MLPEKSGNPLLRFGVIADPQYAPITPNTQLDRHYANSLAKLQQALSHFDGLDLSFVVTLGDLIDRDFDNFDRILPVYEGSRHECLFLPGNHDFAVAPERLGEVHARLGMPAPYHDFVRHGWRFILLDGNEISLFSPPPGDARRTEAADRLARLEQAGAVNAKPWNAGMSQTQIGWLGERLLLAEQAGEKVVVMGHYPLYPQTDHNLWDGEQVAALLSASPVVAAYLCGHNHVGNYGFLGACHFVNFKGMVDGETESAFAVVELHDDRIEIIGFGREESRSLAF